MGLSGLIEAWKSELPGLADAAFSLNGSAVTHSITHHRYRLGIAEAQLDESALSAPLPHRICLGADRGNGSCIGQFFAAEDLEGGERLRSIAVKAVIGPIVSNMSRARGAPSVHSTTTVVVSTGAAFAFARLQHRKPMTRLE